MAISGPIAPYSNVSINAQYYQPSRFEISNISLGLTTTVTTSETHNFVVGQLVRLVIPLPYKTIELNLQEAYVVSVPASNQVVLNISSSGYTAFVSTPYTATITNITKAANAVVTANNSFQTDQTVKFSDVSGMTEINDLVGSIVSANSSSFTVSINSTAFTTYTANGTATLYNVPLNKAQILAIGDINSGAINSSGRVSNISYINGSFINISPE